MSESGNILSGELKWQKEALKAGDIDVIFNACKEKLVELMKGQEEQMSESEMIHEATVLLVNDIVREVLCPCGCGHACQYPQDKPINHIVRWFNSTKRDLPSYDTTD